MATSRSSDDADAVNDRLVQLLEQVVAHQTRTAAGRIGLPPTPAGLNPAQRRLVLEFRALRNGLGNLTRHGDQTVVLMPRPLLGLDATLRFVEPLPHGSVTLRIFDRSGTQVDQHHVSAGTTSVTDVHDAASIQVDDDNGEPFLLGFPIFEPAQEQ